MPGPLLRQCADLVPADFEAAPVWIGCHTADYDEPWYDDTDEETFRPFAGPLPASPGEGMLLVRAQFTLGDGAQLHGFVTPAFEEEVGLADLLLGTQQPAIFAADRILQFWCGGIEPTPARMAETYQALGRGPRDTFPITFRAAPGLATGMTDGIIRGFYWLEGAATVHVSR